jgi:hypothetical protein
VKKNVDSTSFEVIPDLVILVREMFNFLMGDLMRKV